MEEDGDSRAKSRGEPKPLSNGAVRFTPEDDDRAVVVKTHQRRELHGAAGELGLYS